jgi:hypothetical protein
MIDKIQLILDNMNRTIEGKSQLLARLEGAPDEVSNVTAAFLKLNVDELVRIRDDIHLLVEPAPVQVEKDPRQMELDV